MSKYPALDKVLSDRERTLLQKFVSEQEMNKAVKKVILFAVYYNGTLEKDQEPDPTRNALLGLMGNSRSMPNEHLGQVLRAQMEALTFLENGFKTIEDLSKPEVTITAEEINQAR